MLLAQRRIFDPLEEVVPVFVVAVAAAAVLPVAVADVPVVDVPVAAVVPPHPVRLDATTAITSRIVNSLFFIVLSFFVLSDWPSPAV